MARKDNDMIKWYVLVIEDGKPIFITSEGEFADYVYYTPGEKPVDFGTSERAKLTVDCLTQQGITAYVVFSYHKELDQPISDLKDKIQWSL